jgi:hypothetical protein
MKKSTRKIGIRREILRVLGRIDLVAVAGGDTGDPAGGCVNAQVMDTGGGANNTCVQAAQPAPAKP